eukprot:TRINITY_DN4036_c0_g1_i2.p2 TRINITY_DN4036_c0_g1~~TRINITY_DN4036_c0_g1_i2.p2  ORF type:complete len:233 (-),score=4.88 TRINITY_DN4036_c0_g1_i2:428-1126(-)
MLTTKSCFVHIQACVSNQTRFPGVYTRISAYTQWIDSIVQQGSSTSVASPPPLFSMIDTPSIIVNDDFSVGIDIEFTPKQQQGCITQGGCECKQNWEYNGASAFNCDNPDNDPVGSWCVVESNGGCQPLSVVSRTGELWDRCSCSSESLAVAKSKKDTLEPLCESTMLGCTCEETWTYGAQEYYGCNKPDEDPLGSWCKVNITSCARPLLISDNKYKGFDYDYCKQGCQLIQ